MQRDWVLGLVERASLPTPFRGGVAGGAGVGCGVRRGRRGEGYAVEEHDACRIDSGVTSARYKFDQACRIDRGRTSAR